MGFIAQQNALSASLSQTGVMISIAEIKVLRKYMILLHGENIYDHQS